MSTPFISAGPLDFGDVYVIQDEPEPDTEPTPDVPIVDGYTEPDDGVIKKPRRPPNAYAYEKKVTGVLNMGMRFAVQNPETVADGAAIIMYGPAFATAMGDWAAKDARIRRGIDLITDGTDNPAMATVLALMPLALQVLRNHEPIAEAEPRTVRVKLFGRRLFRFRINLKLRGLRNLTNDPTDFAQHVFESPLIAAALKKQDIRVADISKRRRFRRRSAET